jgi:NADH-quinone oxidoreductase subunit K
MNFINSIAVENFIILSAILFCIGISGIFINRKNIISVLMSIELMLLAVNINFVVFSAALQNMVGQIMAIFILTVAAAEAAIGLAILVIYYQNKKSIQISDVSTMKG